jgi:hypothetical protein
VQKQRQSVAIDDLGILADFGVKTVDNTSKSPAPMSPTGLSDFASSPDRDSSLSPTAGAASAVSSFASRGNGRVAADAPSGSDRKFLARKDKRKIEQAFPSAGADDVSEHAKSTGTPPSFESVGNFSAKTDRHMFDTLQAQAKAVRARTEQVGQAILSEHHMADPPEEDPLSLTQETVTVVGRVCMERGAPKLTQQSVGIECVWSTDMGEHSERARLDVHQLPRYSLFPGQIVAVEGVITQVCRPCVQNAFSGRPMTDGLFHSYWRRSLVAVRRLSRLHGLSKAAHSRLLIVARFLVQASVLL